MKFVKLTEINDWEGETWHFYLQLEGNEKAIKHLADVITKEDHSGEGWEFNTTSLIEENEVDILIKHGRTDYMDEHNKVAGKLDMDKMIDQAEQQGDTILDLMYKGGIKKFFVVKV